LKNHQRALIGELQRSAGFGLSASAADPFYCKNSVIPKYINQWTACGNSSRQPTWKNFLSILRELKEVAIAEQIEGYLKESTAHIKSTQALKSIEGKDLNACSTFVPIKYYNIIILLHTQLRIQVQKK
jgi:hypothetical protein